MRALATWVHTAGYAKISSVRVMPYTMGLRRAEVVDCGREGNYRFEGLPRLGIFDTSFATVQVYRVRPDTGVIDACSDLGRQSDTIQYVADLRTDLKPCRSLVFNCGEATLVGLTDPRFLQDLGDVLALDARRNAEPQRFNLTVIKQMMAGFFEPDMRLYLVFRFGRVGNRLILLNTGSVGSPAAAASARSGQDIPGEGYRLAELNRLGPVAMATATDFFNLDSIRIEQYRQAGVSSQLIDTMHEQARTQLEAAGAVAPLVPSMPPAQTGQDGPTVRWQRTSTQARGKVVEEGEMIQALSDQQAYGRKQPRRCATGGQGNAGIARRQNRRRPGLRRIRRWPWCVTPTAPGPTKPAFTPRRRTWPTT